MPQKNLTLTIDEDLLQKARVLAAMKRTSVNEMVRAYLARAIEEETLRDETSIALIKLSQQSQLRLGGPPPTRDEIYSGDKRFDR